MYTTNNFNADFKPTYFTSNGKFMLNGEEIAYHTVSQDNVFYDIEGKPIASIYSFSYFRDGVDPTHRPVVFAFNGGPGSASMYVHAGFFGVKRMKYEETDRITSLPPYEVIDNPDSLLDIADIVLIDPVGCGYGVLIDEKKGEEFYGIEEDAEALLTFIEQWCHQHNRWLSPKYLAGESYGCTRNAVAAGISVSQGKERTYGVRFDGLIMIGNTVTVGEFFNENVRVEPSVLNFPTFAAIHHYHNQPSTQSVEEFVKEAKAFADSEYLVALYQGEACVNRKEIIQKITYYTGMSEEYLENNALKIEEETFRQEVIKHKGMAVSRYDGRITRPLFKPQVDEEKLAVEVDATADRYDGFFYGALTGHILPSLNVRLNRPYIPSSLKWASWNTKVKGGTTAKRLRDAMNCTFGMRTFFANGWYDDCTEIGHVYYTMDHAGLPKDRIVVKGYKSGHMIYIGEDNCHELAQDIRKFILHQEI